MVAVASAVAAVLLLQLGVVNLSQLLQQSAPSSVTLLRCTASSSNRGIVWVGQGQACEGYATATTTGAAAEKEEAVTTSWAKKNKTTTTTSDEQRNLIGVHLLLSRDERQRMKESKRV